MDTVLVTGGTRGLGLAICQRLVQVGFQVVAVGRTRTDSCKTWLASSDLAHFEAYDFCNTADIHAFSQSMIQKYGRFYGLVNNAATGIDGVLATLHESDIAASLKINVEAPMLLTKYLVRSMMINQRGRVVNISSIVANTGYKGLSVYGATKAAMDGFTRSLAREVGKAGITVNSVAPGYMATDMTCGLDETKLQSIRRRSPLGALVSTRDVANMVHYLLSDEAGMVTGAVMTVDAGSSA